MAEPNEQAIDPELYMLELRSDYRMLWLASLAYVGYYGSLYVFKSGTSWLSAAERSYVENSLGFAAGLWAVFYLAAWRGWSGIRSSWWIWFLNFFATGNNLAIYEEEIAQGNVGNADVEAYHTYGYAGLVVFTYYITAITRKGARKYVLFYLD